MAARQSMKYGVAAAALALAIIGLALVANPFLANTGRSTTSSNSAGSNTSSQQAGNFLVLLTDPPIVPAGTTQLNMTYSGLSLRVAFANGTSSWVPVTASGTVNLLALVNVSQTIGSANMPQGSTVNAVQFTISSVSATIGGQVYPVTTLSSQLVVPIKGSQALNQTRSAALLDLSPTLVQINSTNSTGSAVSYYVLVPSATAIIKSNVSGGEGNVGTKTQLEQTDKDELEQAQQAGMGNVTITSTTLMTSGNTTKFSITLKNQGSSNATIFGLTLHGNFSATASPSNVCSQTTSATSKSSTSTTSTTTTSSHGKEGNPPGQSSTSHGQGQEGCNAGKGAADHPDTIPFKVNGTALVPLFGDGSDKGGNGAASSVTLQPGQSITLSFTGVIGLKTDSGQHGQNLLIGSISGNSYTIRLQGEGFQTAQVTAA
jgi:Domain of unknown function (DUF4382)